MESRVQSLENWRNEQTMYLGNIRRRLDELEYEMTVIMRRNPDALNDIRVKCGSINLLGSVAIGLSASPQGWVWLDSAVSSIGSCAFKGKGLKDVFFSGGCNISQIGNMAFRECPIEFIAIPASATTLGNAAFAGCTKLTRVKFAVDSKLSIVGQKAFSCCVSLQAIDIPVGVTEIPEKCFEACGALKAVHFLGSVVRIGPGAFHKCVSLPVIEIPISVEIIGGGQWGAFECCTALERVIIPEGAALAEIQKDCFFKCAKLQAVGPAPNLKWIGERAFFGCAALLELPESAVLEEVGAEAAKGCVSIRAVKFPPTLRAIGPGAFHGCAGIGLVDGGGAHLEFVGDFAFGGCTALYEVQRLSVPAQHGTDAFPVACLFKDQ